MKFEVELNHKSIVDCDNEKDILRHNEDCEKIMGKIAHFAKYGVVVKKEYLDDGHKNKVPTYRYFGRHEDIGSGVVEEACDLKNGADFVIQNGLFASIAHGQGYTIGKDPTYHLVETLNSYHFLNEKGMKAVEELEESDSFYSGQAIEQIIQDESNLLDTKEVLEEVKGVKRKPIDQLIEEATAKLEEQRGGKGKEKSREKEAERSI